MADPRRPGATVLTPRQTSPRRLSKKETHSLEDQLNRAFVSNPRFGLNFVASGQLCGTPGGGGLEAKALYCCSQHWPLRAKSQGTLCSQLMWLCNTAYTQNPEVPPTVTSLC